MKETLSKIFDIIGEILAVVLVLVFALLIINANFHFLNRVPKLLQVLTYIHNIGGFVLIGVVGLEAMVKRHIVLFIIFAVLLGLCVIFMFFPGTYANLLGLIPGRG